MQLCLKFCGTLAMLVGREAHFEILQVKHSVAKEVVKEREKKHMLFV